MAKKPIIVDVIPVKQSTFSFFLFVMSASMLWRLTQINKRSEDKDEGYQRALSNARVRNIAKYIQQGGMLAGSVVVSLDEGTYDKGKQQLKLPNKDNIGWIIDGQHRLAGAYEASKKKENDLSLPVIAFLNLSIERQVELFITINKEARGVPAELPRALLNFAERALR
jgi:DGQHR domain-containing protein